MLGLFDPAVTQKAHVSVFTGGCRPLTLLRTGRPKARPLLEKCRCPLSQACVASRRSLPCQTRTRAWRAPHWFTMAVPASTLLSKVGSQSQHRSPRQAISCHVHVSQPLSALLSAPAFSFALPDATTPQIRGNLHTKNISDPASPLPVVRAHMYVICCTPGLALQFCPASCGPLLSHCACIPNFARSAWYFALVTLLQPVSSVQGRL